MTGKKTVAPNLLTVGPGAQGKHQLWVVWKTQSDPAANFSWKPFAPREYLRLCDDCWNERHHWVCFFWWLKRHWQSYYLITVYCVHSRNDLLGFIGFDWDAVRVEGLIGSCFVLAEKGRSHILKMWLAFMDERKNNPLKVKEFFDLLAVVILLSSHTRTSEGLFGCLSRKREEPRPESAVDHQLREKNALRVKELFYSGGCNILDQLRKDFRRLVWQWFCLSREMEEPHLDNVVDLYEWKKKNPPRVKELSCSCNLVYQSCKGLSAVEWQPPFVSLWTLYSQALVRILLFIVYGLAKHAWMLNKCTFSHCMLAVVPVDVTWPEASHSRCCAALEKEDFPWQG